MNPFLKSRTRRWLLLALAVFTLLPITVSAQDRTDRLKQALDLTDAQVALVEQAVGDEAERGDLWKVSAALAPTLTDAQKQKLFTRPERPAQGEEMRGARRDSLKRSGDAGRAKRERPQGERPDAEARTEQREKAHEAMKADMQAALNLTDAQVQQLEALHAERKAGWEARRAEGKDQQQPRAERPEPGELPAELASILTPPQQEIAKVHQALAAHMMRGRMHRGGARR